MIKPYIRHNGINRISYLGCKIQYHNNMQIMPNSLPIWYGIKDSYNFIGCCHAYAIDPCIARNLISHVIKFGMIGPVDNCIRIDLFNITQDDLFAYEEPENSTIEKHME